MPKATLFIFGLELKRVIAEGGIIVGATDDVPTQRIEYALSEERITKLLNGIDRSNTVAVAEAIAGECFDISNNPDRYDEWAKLTGATETKLGARSLSVGDMVEVEFQDGKKHFVTCLSFGWHVCETEEEGEEIREMLEEASTWTERSSLANRLNQTKLLGA